MDKPVDSKPTFIPSALNPKFRSIKGEFIYKKTLWASWTTEAHIRRFEQEFTFNANDIVLASYPKSGVTWVSEIVSLLKLSQGSPDLLPIAMDEASRIPIYERVLFVEETWDNLYPGCTVPTMALDYLLERGDQDRLIKTHLPFRCFRMALERSALPGPRIVYVFRNPKDVAVSMYHFYRGLKDYGPFEGDWNEFFDMWQEGWITGGDWRDTVPEWLGAVHNSAWLIYPLSYERLSRDPYQCIEDLFHFLFPDRTLDREVLNRIVERTSFEQMRQNPMVNHESCDIFTPDFRFIRKGRVGGWKDSFTEAQAKRHDEAYAEAVAQVNRLLENTHESPLTFE